jgi:hypothetical protein
MQRYSEAFCEVDRLRCLMPIEYEAIKETVNGKIYKKVRCAYRHVLSGNCNSGTECDHYIAAQEIIEE